MTPVLVVVVRNTRSAARYNDLLNTDQAEPGQILILIERLDSLASISDCLKKLCSIVIPVC